jgi:hypothetical protein
MIVLERTLYESSMTMSKSWSSSASSWNSYALRKSRSVCKRTSEPNSAPRRREFVEKENYELKRNA